ncbi:MAG: A24 family peptidase [Alphaproteobacteria bacterium]
MNYTDMAFVAALLVVFPGTMALAGISDLMTMKISNRITVGLSVAFVLLAVWSGMPLEMVGKHMAAGGAMLIIGIAMFAAGWIGGGDAKLFAATALWLGWDTLLAYTLEAAIFGGVLTLAILLFRRAPLPAWLKAPAWVERLHRADEGVPYGVALAAAGLSVYTQSYWLNAAFS